jgi:leucyl-tRNA synthetase
MAKNKGNFRTLVDSVDMYSADGMRFVLANCGDSVADANFDEKESNAVILDLFSLYKFVEETQGKLESYPDRAPESLFDRVFDNQMNRAVIETERDYEQTNFHQAVAARLPQSVERARRIPLARR